MRRRHRIKAELDRPVIDMRESLSHSDGVAAEFPAAGKDMSKATMGIAVSVDTVKAGEITFEVLNSSKDAIHEVIITRLRDLTMLFPYNSSIGCPYRG